ncbi:hypothetical protein CBER1_01547 [Cercospora berteroae]|uniref:Mso1 N-terminal domain-containing protein n=1 Tax=Cercospora berteroae TaxID=357750 RepID=A0A2S6C5Q1_9PEZI|nr:hypothetical protein CBER1_01547 [Cercospora berteroae]
MSSYLSNLLTHTTSRYNSLRRTLLSSEDDGDTEDDTHICRVLRAHYTEKGRPFPPWLPPDPKEKHKAVPQQYGQQGGYGSYLTSAGGKSPYGAMQAQGGNRGSSSLSDLWDAPSGGQSNVAAQPQSLRNARRPLSNQPASASSTNLAPPQARPLPSQRAGSYQTMGSQQTGSRPGSAVDPSPPTTSSGAPSAGSAQDRLKARLWGAKGNTSPSATPAPSGPQSYDRPQAGGYGGGGANPYDRAGGDGRRYGR